MTIEKFIKGHNIRHLKYDALLDDIETIAEDGRDKTILIFELLSLELMKKILLRPEQDDPNDSNFWIKEFEYDPKKLEKCLIDCVQSLISQFDFNLIKDICNNFLKESLENK